MTAYERVAEDAAPGALLTECLDVIAQAEPEQEMTGPEQAQAWLEQARDLWRARDLAGAAAYIHAAGQADPSREPEWRNARVRLLAAAASRLSLAQQNRVRLSLCGITADDPGFRQVAAHNAAVQDREAAS